MTLIPLYIVTSIRLVVMTLNSYSLTLVMAGILHQINELVGNFTQEIALVESLSIVKF